MEIIPGEPLHWVSQAEEGWLNITILDLSNAISRKRRKIGAKLVLITNRKLHVSFRLAPNLVTLDALEWCNSPNCSVISLSSVRFRGRLRKSG